MTMQSALQSAGKAVYTPTRHAIERARLRFGIDAEHVSEWINAMMAQAERIGTSGAKGVVYKSEDVRIVVDETTGLVITLHPELDAGFLKPALERERRKLNRLYTRRIRKHELAYAEALQELASMAINRARARNPHTREIIADRMSDKQSEIDGLVREIERLQDDWQAKVRAIEVIAE